MAEDRREPPYDAGSQPVVHEKEPVPGLARSTARTVTVLVAVLVLVAVAIYVFGRL